MGLINQTQQDYYQGNDFGGYQFISIEDVIDNFAATFVGEGKILQNVLRADISFHAHRALQELSFDTFKSCKSQEIEVPPHLTMPLPQDYVNYVKLVWSDDSGIEHIIYPALKTSNPFPIQQNDSGDYYISVESTFTAGGNTLTLDGEYSNIKTGMRVYSQHLPIDTGTGEFMPTFIQKISTASGVTTLQIGSGSISWGGMTIDATEDVKFMEADDTLTMQPETSLIVTGLTWNTTDRIITAASAGDITNVKPGRLIYSNQMQASTPQHPIGTKVVSVNGTTIHVDTLALTPSNSSYDDITFISETKVSDTWSNYKSATPSENNTDDYEDDTYWPVIGGRYGINPQHAQINGSYYIDCHAGKIHFSSNLSGKTVSLKYISDSLGTDEEMQVHKFAEEAMYKWIAYGCLAARVGIPEYIIARFKKERFAETRKAKLRLSNIKLEEITQIFRGKSKQIKH